MISVTALPAFKDNYLWLLESLEETWVVDPGDGKVVAQALADRGKTLTGILITHHHPDHIGGVEHLIHEHTDHELIVAGPKLNQFRHVGRGLVDEDQIKVCGQNFKVLAVPGHTLNHIAYVAEPVDQAPLLFCGDTLFAGGCGRLFEGTPEQMHHSLQRLVALPAETEVYCAHEYTLANLNFALTLEPSNQNLQNRIVEVQYLRHQNKSTIPTLMAVELETNPFLRVDSSEIISSARRENSSLELSPEAVFAQIRSMKDAF